MIWINYKFTIVVQRDIGTVTADFGQRDCSINISLNFFYSRRSDTEDKNVKWKVTAKVLIKRKLIKLFRTFSSITLIYERFVYSCAESRRRNSYAQQIIHRYTF